MNYRESIDYLYGLRWFGTKLGLSGTRRLAELAGNPQAGLRFIHVAGTNGKGSVCAMLEAIYRERGYRVGLFTSPHLVSFGERIQVNRRPLPEEETVELVREVRPLLSRFSEEEHPTFFEVVVVMGLLHFARAGCEVVVWETGLGGRLDATNIVRPLASVITNIQYDHQQWLGDTLAKIAGEKAGIIKEGVPTVTGVETAEALAVIREVAAGQGSPLTEVKAEATRRPPLKGARFSLLGEHQRMNAAIALATARVLERQLPVKEAQALAALTRVHWPGRLQVIARAGNRRVVLDGAHNEGGAEVLATTLREHFAGERCTLILGMLEDKDWGKMCGILAPVASKVVLVPVASERTAPTEALAAVCREKMPGLPVVEKGSLRAALEETREDSFVTIAGSLYLVGEALELLGATPEGSGSERKLNEWSADPEAGMNRKQ